MTGRRIFGIGGIGRGIFFQSEDNQTLGREESRLARQLDALDYCKLHIVFHYIARFAAPRSTVVPIGYVGKDDAGRALRQEMAEAGMDVASVMLHPEKPTMLSICLQYPDKSGCNITSSNSACEALDPESLLTLLQERNPGPQDYVVALPEVPMQTRAALLRAGTEAGAFRAASFAEAEIPGVLRQGLLQDCDLLAANQGETSALCGFPVTDLDSAERAAIHLMQAYPRLKLWLTVGGSGSVSAEGGVIRRYRAMPATVCNTGGAGDATLGGILAALAWGLPFHEAGPEFSWQPGTMVSTAAAFGALLGGLSVSSPDSIDFRQEPGWIQHVLSRNGWSSGLGDLLKKDKI